MCNPNPVADFQKLFEASTKDVAQRTARQLVLDAAQFGDLIQLAQKIGFTHSLIRKEWAPRYATNVPGLMDQLLAGTKSENRKIKNKGSAAFNLITELFVQRKLVFAHFFEKPEGWHVFYFTEQDYHGVHFAHPHVHYASHLWSFDLAATKAKFDSRDYSFATEHLQIIPISN